MQNPSWKSSVCTLVTAEYDNGTEGYEKASDKQLKDEQYKMITQMRLRLC